MRVPPGPAELDAERFGQVRRQELGPGGPGEGGGTKRRARRVAPFGVAARDGIEVETVHPDPVPLLVVLAVPELLEELVGGRPLVVDVEDVPAVLPRRAGGPSTATIVRTPRALGPSPVSGGRVSATRRRLRGAPVKGPGSQTVWKARAGRARHWRRRAGSRGARTSTVTPGVARSRAATAASDFAAPASRRSRRWAVPPARRSRWAIWRATW
jgi:hypothetical protein